MAGLAERLRGHAPTAICGPLLGGAFLAQAVATALGVKFFAVEPVLPGPGGDAGLFTARYRLPPGQRPRARGECVAVVDDVISAGSSVRAAVAALTEEGAAIAAIELLAGAACDARGKDGKPKRVAKGQGACAHAHRLRPV